MSRENLKGNYPLVIIGGGPAGLTASIYASRYRVGHLIISEAMGGLAFEAHRICNFPTEKDISGPDLTRKMEEHARALGASFLLDKVVETKEEGGLFRIHTQGEKIFLAKAILLALGTEHRKMDLPDEERFLGKGVSYCATCDGPFYKDKIVAVIGGSDTANTSSLYLSQIAKKVYQIYRQDKLRGETAWIEQIKNNEKIEVIYQTTVVGLKGKEKLEGVVLSRPYNGQKEIQVDGLFIEIGTVPQELLMKQLNLERDKEGYIKVNEAQMTSHPGVWAAGDITTNSNEFRQVITACAEGAVAAESIFKFLNKKR